MTPDRPRTVFLVAYEIGIGTRKTVYWRHVRSRRHHWQWICKVWLLKPIYMGRRTHRELSENQCKMTVFALKTDQTALVTFHPDQIFFFFFYEENSYWRRFMQSFIS